MKLSHEQLMTSLTNLSIPQPDEFSALLLLKKREDLIRDLLFMKLLINNQPYYPYPDWKPRSYVKHDCAIFTSDSMSKNRPVSIIEIKYATSSFILDKRLELDPSSNINKKQDNVWIEGFISRSKKTGIIEDLNRMFKTVDQNYKNKFTPSIHQILVIAVPKNIIPTTKYLLHTDYKRHNYYLSNFNNNADLYITEVKNVLTEQFLTVNQVYFPEYQFESNFCSKSLGNAFQTVNMELLFFVLSAKV